MNAADIIAQDKPNSSKWEMKGRKRTLASSQWGRRELEKTRRRNEGKWGLPVGIGIELGWQRRRGCMTNWKKGANLLYCSSY